MTSSRSGPMPLGLINM